MERETDLENLKLINKITLTPLWHEWKNHQMSSQEPKVVEGKMSYLSPSTPKHFYFL